MKKIKYITILILTLLSISSCEYYDDDYGHNEKTAAAKLVYDETVGTIQRYVEVLNVSQTIDKYLQSEDQEERDSIKVFQLRGYDLLETDTIISVWHGDGGSVWTITRNSTDPLSTPSTVWKIEGNCMAFNIPKDGFIITAQPTANTWSVKVADSYSHDGYNQNYNDNYNNYYGNSKTISSAYLNVQVTTDSYTKMDSYIITMAGDEAGKIDATTGDMFNTSFKITSPIETNIYRFVKGKIEMEVVRNHDSKDSISADIRGGGDRIAILFRGITEMW